MDTKKTVREIRQERGWTQMELSRRSGVHPVSLSRIEAGRTVPTVRNLRRIADALQVSTDSIVLLQAVGVA